MTNTDHYYEIGHDHKECQDYALSGIGPTGPYAIISDGCSASPEVDIGARMVALAARDVIFTDPTAPWDDMGQQVIKKACKIFETYKTAHPQILDATLLVAILNGNKLTAHMYGDGVFIHKRGDKIIYQARVELTSGAPDYLSYTLDKGRQERYLTLEGIKQFTSITNDMQCTVDSAPFSPTVILRDLLPGDVVAISSDGIGSYRKSDNKIIPWAEMVPEFVNYKRFNGVFTRRCMNFLAKKHRQELTTHGDDVSVAAIHFNPDNE